MRSVTIAILATVSVLSAANAPVRQALTATEVVFSYSRPDATACTWAVSTSATYSPLVAELVGSQSDSATLGARWFLVGHTSALSASTAYYWQQTCGAEVYTGTFTTPAVLTGGSGAIYLSMGEMTVADNATVSYGLTSALGSTVNAPCTPGCAFTINSTSGAILFYSIAYKNGADTINAGSVHVAVVP
ncbi:MAG: hypothetical protein ABSB88_06085 [Bryobacteraceae bacterium]|jgi:hypothetical protein